MDAHTCMHSPDNPPTPLPILHPFHITPQRPRWAAFTLIGLFSIRRMDLIGSLVTLASASNPSIGTTGDPPPLASKESKCFVTEYAQLTSGIYQIHSNTREELVAFCEHPDPFLFGKVKEHCL